MKTVCIFFSFLFFSFQNDNNGNSESLKYTDISISGLKIPFTLKEVKKALGKPTKSTTYYNEIEDRNDETYYYNKSEFSTDGEYVKIIFIKDTIHKVMPYGISIGTKLDSVNIHFPIAVANSDTFSRDETLYLQTNIDLVDEDQEFIGMTLFMSFDLDTKRLFELSIRE